MADTKLKPFERSTGMREILFRGKRKDNGEWVEGFYFERKDTQCQIIEAIIIEDAYEQVTGGQRYIRSDLNHDCYRVDPVTVGQYTGLQDKNGQRIFEGDIFKFPEELDFESPMYTADQNKHINIGLKIALRAIKKTPAADVVEVVRCAECLHWHEDVGWCDKHSHFILSNGEFCHPWESSSWKMFDAEYWCADGERRDNNAAD